MSKITLQAELPIIGQSHDFWRAYSLFVARVRSFAPEWSEVANDTIRAKMFHDVNFFNQYSSPGLLGCRPFLDYWRHLTDVANIIKFAQR